MRFGKHRDNILSGVDTGNPGLLGHLTTLAALWERSSYFFIIPGLKIRQMPWSRWFPLNSEHWQCWCCLWEWDKFAETIDMPEIHSISEMILTQVHRVTPPAALFFQGIARGNAAAMAAFWRGPCYGFISCKAHIPGLQKAEHLTGDIPYPFQL